MILGIGTDIIEIARMKIFCEKPYYVSKIYTENECRLAREKLSFLAGNFAAKEAVCKALGTGFRGFGAKEVEILRDELGAPYVRLYGRAEEIFFAKNASHIHVSISHCREYASAFAVLEGNYGAMD
ncbi:MAG: holo-ACP synthase [Johnsonella sp.]|nr:holo-ACP synthase [Johnsonella sp.]